MSRVHREFLCRLRNEFGSKRILEIYNNSQDPEYRYTESTIDISFLADLKTLMSKDDCVEDEFVLRLATPVEAPETLPQQPLFKFLLSLLTVQVSISYEDSISAPLLSARALKQLIALATKNKEVDLQDYSEKPIKQAKKLFYKLMGA
jgi:hypothetical protein